MVFTVARKDEGSREVSGAVVWQWTVALESDIEEEQGHGKLAFKNFGLIQSSREIFLFCSW